LWLVSSIPLSVDKVIYAVFLNVSAFSDKENGNKFCARKCGSDIDYYSEKFVYYRETV